MQAFSSLKSYRLVFSIEQYISYQELPDPTGIAPLTSRSVGLPRSRSGACIKAEHLGPEGRPSVVGGSTDVAFVAGPSAFFHNFHARGHEAGGPVAVRTRFPQGTSCHARTFVAVAAIHLAHFTLGEGASGQALLSVSYCFFLPGALPLASTQIRSSSTFDGLLLHLPDCPARSFLPRSSAPNVEPRRSRRTRP